MSLHLRVYVHALSLSLSLSLSLALSLLHTHTHTHTLTRTHLNRRRDLVTLKRTSRAYIFFFFSSLAPPRDHPLHSPKTRRNEVKRGPGPPGTATSTSELFKAVGERESAWDRALCSLNCPRLVERVATCNCRS
jgi:hypothetical protein